MPRFKLYLFSLITAFFFSSCSSATLDWPPDDDDKPLLILGPVYQSESLEPYRNIRLLNTAISAAADEHNAEIAGEDEGGFSKVNPYNWILDFRDLGYFRRQIERSLAYTGKQQKENGVERAIVSVFGEREYQGHLLIVRFLPTLQSRFGKRQLEGFRVVFFSQEELEINYFRLPIDLGVSARSLLLKKSIRRLMSSLKFASPSLGKMGFSRIEGGCFSIGDNLPDEECVNEFYMGKYPVTMKQWSEVLKIKDPEPETSEKYSVVNVSWEEIQFFLKKLNEQSAYTYRLPTAIEWEYACKAGKQNLAYGTNTGSISPQTANYTNAEKDLASRGISTNDAFPPNHFDLYEMSGNTWEWTQDQYLTKNRKGIIGSFISRFAKDSKKRIIRGGSFDNLAKDVSCNSEQLISGSIGAPDIGFRLILE